MEKIEKTLLVKCREDLNYISSVIFLIMSLHENYFHGDLHSQNIMVEDNGVPIIIDFGKTKNMPKDEDSRTWCILHDLQNLHNTLPMECKLKNHVLEYAKRICIGLRVKETTFEFY